MGLHPNVEVRHDELMGRSIVAKEAFAPGEVIVKDEPILVWDDPVDKGYPFLLRAFNKCDKKTQGRILSMYHPALDRASPMLDLRRKKAVELCKTKEFGALSRDTVLALLLLADCNSHDYSRVKGGTPGVDRRAALYVDASLCCHDCRPNCRFRSHGDGALEYTCIRDIPVDGHVTFCYTGTPWWLTTRDRRERLLKRFDFFCRCERCAAPDPLRSAKCPDCGRVCPLTEPDAPDVPDGAIFWKCEACQLPFDARDAERRLAAELEALREKAHASLKHLEERFAIGQPPVSSAPDAAAVRRDIDAFVWRAGQELAPAHHLAFRATAILANASMNLARANGAGNG